MEDDRIEENADTAESDTSQLLKVGAVFVICFVIVAGIIAIWNAKHFINITENTHAVENNGPRVSINISQEESKEHNSKEQSPDERSTTSSQYQQYQGKKWYEGGTLHKAGALEWQNATYDNKMATCADFFSALYKDRKFKQTILSSIKSTDDMVPYVEKLVADMDIALSKEEDSDKNRKMYKNQTVSEIAAILMMMNGWLKPN
jgi:hypothetical protein